MSNPVYFKKETDHVVEQRTISGTFIYTHISFKMNLDYILDDERSETPNFDRLGSRFPRVRGSKTRGGRQEKPNESRTVPKLPDPTQSGPTHDVNTSDSLSLRRREWSGELMSCGRDGTLCDVCRVF